jgi:hypothetical protein
VNKQRDGWLSRGWVALAGGGWLSRGWGMAKQRDGWLSREMGG